MDAQALREAMFSQISLARAQQLVAGANEALTLAQCFTVQRAAMFLAQTGHESVSLIYTAEIASGAAYNGRRDLGNTQPGDGPRFKGRSFIQITGRANYGSFSRWAYGKGLVSSPTYFVDHPLELSSDRWAWIGAVWYWTVARQMNTYSDRGDIYGATRAVNGGLNGINDRINRWRNCLRLGARILPTGGGEDMANVPQEQWDQVFHALTDLVKPWPGGLSDKEPAKLDDPNVAGYSLLQYALRNNVEIHRTRAELAALRNEVAALRAERKV